MDKPLHWTSFDLVNLFRRAACNRLGIKRLKVGHAGTLDPLASGVVIICTSKSTKKIDLLQAGKKEYIAGIYLGATTPSFDKETEIDKTYPSEHINQELIQDILPQFIGTIEQIPPAYSACKVDGKRAYKLARKGKEVNLKPKTLTIDSIEIISYQHPHLQLKIICSKGTYIRALARDIGKALQSGAYLESLIRTRVGEARLDDCISPTELDDYLNSHCQKLTSEEINLYFPSDEEKKRQGLL